VTRRRRSGARRTERAGRAAPGGEARRRRGSAGRLADDQRLGVGDDPLAARQRLPDVLRRLNMCRCARPS
jgi:hypothetical protein